MSVVATVQPCASVSNPYGPPTLAPTGGVGFSGSGFGVIGQPPVVPESGVSKQYVQIPRP